MIDLIASQCVFKKSITAPNNSSSSEFGFIVAFGQSKLIIGAPGKLGQHYCDSAGSNTAYSYAVTLTNDEVVSTFKQKLDPIGQSTLDILNYGSSGI